jgi:hypothetical protein
VTPLQAGDLLAVPDPQSPDVLAWSVWRGRERVGALEQRGPAGAVWLAGRIHLVDVDEDLVAEGPTALSVLRRLDCQSTTRCNVPAPTSPVWT